MPSAAGRNEVKQRCSHATRRGTPVMGPNSRNEVRRSNDLQLAKRRNVVGLGWRAGLLSCRHCLPVKAYPWAEPRHTQQFWKRHLEAMERISASAAGYIGKMMGSGDHRQHNGPLIVTESPSVRPKMKLLMIPGGTSGCRGGGEAIRTLSIMIPNSSG